MTNPHASAVSIVLLVQGSALAALSVGSGQLIYSGLASVEPPGATWNLYQPVAATFAPPPQTVSVAGSVSTATANGDYLAVLDPGGFSGAAAVSHFLTDSLSGGSVAGQATANLDMNFQVTQPGWYTLSGTVEASASHRQAAYAEVTFIENAGTIFNITATNSTASLSFDRFLTPGYGYFLRAVAQTLSSNGDVPNFSGSAAALFTWSVVPVPAPGAAGLFGMGMLWVSRRRR